jgi:hypothetical protein
MTDTDRPTPPRLAQYRYVWVERRAPAARRGRLSTLAILRPELPYTGNHDGVIAAYRATLARYEREGHPPCALCGAPAAQAAYFVLLIEALNGPELWPLRWKASTACFRCDARSDDELLAAWLERNCYERKGASPTE